MSRTPAGGSHWTRGAQDEQLPDLALHLLPEENAGPSLPKLHEEVPRCPSLGTAFTVPGPCGGSRGACLLPARLCIGPWELLAWRRLLGSLFRLVASWGPSWETAPRPRGPQTHQELTEEAAGLNNERSHLNPPPPLPAESLEHGSPTGVRRAGWATLPGAACKSLCVPHEQSPGFLLSFWSCPPALQPAKEAHLPGIGTQGWGG